MEEEARRLNININITPWMFKYKELGWGYQPHSKEQRDFLFKYVEYYEPADMLQWICIMENLV